MRLNHDLNFFFYGQLNIFVVKLTFIYYRYVYWLPKFNHFVNSYLKLGWLTIISFIYRLLFVIKREIHFVFLSKEAKTKNVKLAASITL